MEPGPGSALLPKRRGKPPGTSKALRISCIFNFPTLPRTPEQGRAAVPGLAANGGTKNCRGALARLFVCLFVPSPLPVSFLHVEPLEPFLGHIPLKAHPGAPGAGRSSGAPGGSAAGNAGLFPTFPAPQPAGDFCRFSFRFGICK